MDIQFARNGDSLELALEGKGKRISPNDELYNLYGGKIICLVSAIHPTKTIVCM